jgi:hypothetical protein
MKMTPGVRKVALTVHVATSVGWLGAVAAFLFLSVVGLTTNEAEVARAAYLALNVVGLYLIVPLSFAALLSGVLQSLGTEWGLFRHYWIVAKLVLTFGATGLLLLHQFTAVAAAARQVAASSPSLTPRLGGLGSQLIFDAGLAVLVLLGITALSVFKPWGRTPYGHRQLDPSSRAHTDWNDRLQRGRPRMPLGPKLLATFVVLFLVTMIVLHLTGHRFNHGH